MEPHTPLYSDTFYMIRALELARNGLGATSPNPMVGAVIVSPDGRIIGQGWHRRYGGPHAEVNAVRSVADADRKLLHDSTIYVTLEPCAHYGKTPPCALLLVETDFRRVVVGAGDPFAKVDGRGLAILREGGCQVDTGILADESRSLNARFFTAHTLRRPFVTLKWAQSSDGFMDHVRTEEQGSMRFSSRLGQTLVHRLRANHDAIAVGAGTVLADSPRLDVRLWHGTNPRPVVVDRHGFAGTPTADFAEILNSLYAEGITSVLVEGGASLLRSIIADGLWDVARVEVSPIILAKRGAVTAPTIDRNPFRTLALGSNTVYYYTNNPLVNDYFISNGF